MVELEVNLKGNRPNLKQRYTKRAEAYDAVMRIFRVGYYSYRAGDKTVYVPVADIASVELPDGE